MIGNCFFSRFKEPTTDRISVKGLAFGDSNQDCIFNVPEIGLSSQQIQIKDSISENYYSSNAIGEFTFAAPRGNFEIKATDISKYQNSCIKQLDGRTIDPSKIVEVGVQDIVSCPELVIDLSIPRLRRCFESIIYLSFYNKGTEMASNSYIELTLDDNLIFKNATIQPTSILKNIIRFDLGDIKIKGTGSLQIFVEVSCKSSLGAIHCIEAKIYPNKECNQNTLPKIKTAAVCNANTVELFLENISPTSMNSSKYWNLVEYDDAKLSIIESGSFQLQGYEKKSLGIKNGTTKKLFTAEQIVEKNGIGKSQTLINNCLSNNNSQPLNLDEEESYFDKECIQNTGSYDPNDIRGVPFGITSDKRIDRTQEIEYTIRFQNTGTDTATNINIVNNLGKSNLNLSTISYGSSSHPYTMSIVNGSTLIFSFKNIMLPDSHINVIGSNGFLKYKLKPSNTIEENQKVQNSAFIYFDYNDPVETNTEFHTIGMPIVTYTMDVDKIRQDDILLAPNPTQGNILLINKNVNTRFLGSNIKIFDTKGKIVLESKWLKLHQEINVESLYPGYYIVVIDQNNGTRISKCFVKM